MHALVPVTALLAGVAILLTGNGLQGILLPVRAGVEGFGTVSIALVGSSYFAGFAAGCVLGPRMVKGVGHIRTFAAMTAQRPPPPVETYVPFNESLQSSLTVSSVFEAQSAEAAGERGDSSGRNAGSSDLGRRG